MNNLNLTVIPLENILFIEDRSIPGYDKTTPRIYVHFKGNRSSDEVYVALEEEAVELHEKFLSYIAQNRPSKRLHTIPTHIGVI